MWTCQKCNEQIEDQFDSCWNCAGEAAGITPQQHPPLKLINYIFASIASCLMPVLVCFLHGISVLDSNYGIQRTPLYYGVKMFVEPIFWGLMIVPAVITLILLVPFLSSKMWRRIAYACVCLAWLYLAS